MIPCDRTDILEAALPLLEAFAARASVRGRFVALYLGLRRMGSALKRLGSDSATSASEIEQFLDMLYTKTHRPAPYVVLTAPFGQSTSRSAPYSTPTGEIAPGHAYPTNTWRNNFGIQKGVGCPASSEVILRLLESPSLRLGCPHMAEDSEGRHVCGINGTAYRGEEHSIWLRIADGGYQIAPLDNLRVQGNYLIPRGQRIPVFPLIAVLYSLAPPAAYPQRVTVGIPEFAEDFGFPLGQVEELFDCDPESEFNLVMLGAIEQRQRPVPVTSNGVAVDVVANVTPAPFPLLGPLREINNGVGGELAVAADLMRCGWEVTYRGNQRSVGYDLDAQRDGQVLHVEVKSSVGFTSPELSVAEWQAAETYGDQYVLAVVDFYGSAAQALWYVRNPAQVTTPVQVTTIMYRLPRGEIEALRTDVDFL